MLDQKVFLQGINYIKANYLNWQFDLNNDLMLKVWYKKFSNLEDKEYMALLEQYTENSKFGPQSPADIMALVKQNFTSGGAAWDWLLSLNKQYPVVNEYQKPKFYQELKKDQLAYKLFEQLECEPIFSKLDEAKEESNVVADFTTYLGFGFGYRKDKFIKWYDASNTTANKLQLEAPVVNLLGV